MPATLTYIRCPNRLRFEQPHRSLQPLINLSLQLVRAYPEARVDLTVSGPATIVTDITSDCIRRQMQLMARAGYDDDFTWSHDPFGGWELAMARSTMGGVP